MQGPRVQPTVPIIARTRYRLEAERLRAPARRWRSPRSSKRRSRCCRSCWCGSTFRATSSRRWSKLSTRARRRGQPRARAPAIPLDQLPREIVDAPVSSFRLLPEAWAVGRTLQSWTCATRPGATVLAVRRDRTDDSPHGASRGRRATTSSCWVTTATCCSREPAGAGGPRGAERRLGGTGSSGPGPWGLMARGDDVM